MNSTGGGDGVEMFRAEYMVEHASEIPGRSRRLIALLGRVLECARLKGGELDPSARAFIELGGEISREILSRATPPPLPARERARMMRLGR